MRFTLLARRALPVVALAAAIAAGLGSQRTAQGDEPIEDGVPPGTVAFFAPEATCPMGWAPFDPAAGRMIVGVVAPEAVGREVNAPLDDREDRTHTHDFSGTVALSTRQISGANGSNTQGAAGRSYPVSGRTEPAGSGQAFIQLRACVRR